MLLKHSTPGLLAEILKALRLDISKMGDDKSVVDKIITEAFCYILKNRKPGLSFTHL